MKTSGALCSCLLPESLQVTTVKQLPEYHECSGLWSFTRMFLPSWISFELAVWSNTYVVKTWIQRSMLLLALPFGVCFLQRKNVPPSLCHSTLGQSLQKSSTMKRSGRWHYRPELPMLLLLKNLTSERAGSQSLLLLTNLIPCALWSCLHCKSKNCLASFVLNVWKVECCFV